METPGAKYITPKPGGLLRAAVLRRCAFGPFVRLRGTCSESSSSEEAKGDSARFWPVNARDGAKCVAQADKDAPEDFVANFAPASKWKREIRTKRGRNKTRQGADTESFHR